MIPESAMSHFEERPNLYTSEQRVLQTFRQYLMTPGQMLCFSGPELAKHWATLQRMSEEDLLSKEKVKGGYSLTHAGFAAMQELE